MGFFKRLRAGSTTNTDAEASSSPHASSSHSRATSPGPSTHSSHHALQPRAHPTPPGSTRYTQTTPRLSSDLPAPPIRPAAMASGSSSSIVDKFGKKTWRRKNKAADRIAGPSYESTPARSSLGDPVDLRRQWDGARPGGVQDTRSPVATGVGGGGKRDTMVFLGPGAGAGSSSGLAASRSHSFAGSPTSTWGRSDGASMSGNEALDITPKKEKGNNRGSRVSSVEFEQEGGILGRLGFEGRVRSRDNSWIDVRVSPGVSPHVEGTEREVMPNAFETPLVTASDDRADDGDPAQAGKENRGDEQNMAGGRPSDEIEVLESAEKKQKFWKGIRNRRQSRAASDIEDEEPGSPTPRKSTMPQPAADTVQSLASRSSVDIAQPRPQQIRRPSSSLFHNPFARTLSRSSTHELEIPSAPADDGSFQLKSFRHISGTTDVEGLGRLEGYLSHVPRGSMMGLDEPKPLVTPELPSPVNPPPSSFTPGPRPRAPSGNQLSRPPSVAASLASMDDMVTPHRISAAAFRKGIRRPSEGPAAVVTDTKADGDDDDEDDVPLGMISKHKIRDQSASSLSSLKDTPAKENEGPVSSAQSPAHVPTPTTSPAPPPIVASPPPKSDDAVRKSKPATPSPRPSPMPSPALSGKTSNHTKTAPSFVVKGRESRPTSDRRISGDAVSLASPPRSASHSPLPSRASPAPPLAPTRALPAIVTSATVLEPHDVVDSPFPISASDAQPHFPLIAPAPIHQPRRPSAPWFEVADQENDAPDQIATSARASPAARQAPPVEPVELPQRGNTSPSISLDNLPLPPDRMPDTPPKSNTALSPSPAVPTSPTRARTMSMLDEPLRVISGFWASTSGEAKGEGDRESKDSLDRDLVFSSMASYADEDEAKQTEVKPVAPELSIPAASPVSPTEERVRSPIEVRLAAAAAARASARPELAKPASTSSLRDPTSASAPGPAASWIPNDISMNSLSKLIDNDVDDEPATAATRTTLTPPARVLTVPTTLEEKEASAQASPEIESSFARARPVQPRSASAKLHIPRASRDSSIPSLSTLIDEERRRDTIIAAAEQPRPHSVSRAENDHTSGRASPDAGSSFARAARNAHRASTTPLGSSTESDESDTDIMQTKGKGKGKGRSIFARARKHPAGPRSGKTHELSPAVKDESASSSEDESLSVLRAKASRSSLSVHKTLSPGAEPSNTSVSSARSAQSTSSPLNPQTGLSPVANVGRSKTRAESTSSSRPNMSPRKSSKTVGVTASTSSPKLASKSIPNLGEARGRSPTKTDIRLSKLEAKPSGSPGSSSQSATSESLAQHPTTPREANAALQRTSVVDPAGSQWRPEAARERRHSQFPLSGGLPHAQGGFPFNPQMPMPQPGMDQAAMLAMMKQAWQAQFMAAAYRASEDEWERASAVSGQTSNTQAQQPPFSPFGAMGQMQMQMGQVPYGYPSPMGQMPGWPMPGMGMPGMPMPGMGGMGAMPWIPPYAGSSSGQSLISQHTGGGGVGMYGYGAGTQSVFGGEFGPPPQQRSTFYSYPSQSSIDLASYPHPQTQLPSAYETASTTGPASPPRPAFAKHGRTSSSSSQQGPPTAWRQSSYTTYGGAGGSAAGGADGQWDDVPTPRRSRYASGHMVN